MKAIKFLLVAVWVIAIQLNPIRAQVFSVKSHKVSVSGTSTLHDWESTVDKLEANGSFSIADNALADIRDVVIRIPVKHIKSTKGKVMDNKTWEAFDHEKNPTIAFTLTDGQINAEKNTIVASGKLTMAGVTKPVVLRVTYTILPGGELKIRGAHNIIMSHFNMEPPTAMMGTIQVGDEVVVNFDIVLMNANHTF